jgi:ribosomal-protein-alanine N-acetyltransferase
MGTDIYVSRLTAELEQPFIDSVSRSRTLHAPWVSPPGTPQEFQSYLPRVQEPAGAAFVVWEWRSDGFAGIVQITNIVMDPFRSAHRLLRIFGFRAEGVDEGGPHACREAGLQVPETASAGSQHPA